MPLQIVDHIFSASIFSRYVDIVSSSNCHQNENRSSHSTEMFSVFLIYLTFFSFLFEFITIQRTIESKRLGPRTCRTCYVDLELFQVTNVSSLVHSQRALLSQKHRKRYTRKVNTLLDKSFYSAINKVE